MVDRETGKGNNDSVALTAAEIAANGSRWDFVRGASPSTVAAFRRANPAVALSAYIPFTRDMHAEQNLSWWQTHHPTWVSALGQVPSAAARSVGTYPARFF